MNPQPLTGHYGNAALDFYSVNNNLTLANLQFRYAYTGMSFFYPAGQSHTLNDCRIFKSQLGLDVYDTYITANRLIIGDYQTNYRLNGSSTLTLNDYYEISERLVNNVAETGSSVTLRQTEPSITLCGATVAVGFVDFGTSNPANKDTGFSTSPDAGDNFTDLGPLPYTDDGLGNGVDPVVACENPSGSFINGIIYHVTNPEGTNPNQGVLPMFKSTSAGQSFSIVPNDPEPIGFADNDNLDKPWIAVDNFSGTGQGYLYQVFINRKPPSGKAGSVFFNRSIDRGANWSSLKDFEPFASNSEFHVPFVTVGPDHSVYVFYYQQSSRKIKVWRSTNHGVSWTQGGSVALDSPGTYGSGGEYFLEIKRSNNDATVVRNICQPQAVIHPTTGYIYLFSPDIGVNPGDKSDIFYCVSTTSGSSWSAKQKVNDDITVNTANDQWNLAVAIRSTGAQLFVGYYDRQTDGNNGFVEVRGRVGDISGSIVSFRRSITIAPARFEIIDVGLEGDYNTAVGDGSFAYFVWGDNRNRASGTTFYEANIRFAKIKFP